MNQQSVTTQDDDMRLMQCRFDWQRVAPMYQEPHRVYHAITHVHFMLRHAARVVSDEDQHQWLAAVTWLHDAYHDPLATPPHNEQMSADLLDGELGRAFTPAGKALARDAILASAHHTRDQVGLHPLVEVFLDLDISGLAAEDFEFNRQTRAVAEEFRRAGKSTEKIVDAHSRFCEKMLARKSLYYTGDDARERDAIARANLARVVREPLHFV